MTKNKKIICAGLILLGLFIHGWFAWRSIWNMSATYDEPVHLTAGYTYWKTGDYRFNGFHHPAFAEMWAAIPLLVINPALPLQHPAWREKKWTPKDQYAFADIFLYHNRLSHEKLLNAGRAAQMVLSLLLGLFIFWAALRITDVDTALLAFLLWAFSPTFLSQGSLVSTDLAFAVFFFSFFILAFSFRTVPTAAAAGVVLGLCAASKYFALAILPCMGASWLWGKWKEDPGTLHRPLWHGLAMGSVSLVILLAVYRFSSVDVFLEGLKNIIGRSQAGRSSFFMGHHGTEGWMLYFPMVFLFKTPLPVLLGLILAGIAVVRKKVRISTVLWIPPVVFFALSCFSKVQIGHRHLLAIYPFLFLIAAQGIMAWSDQRKIFPSLLILWSLISVVWVSPHFLSYFNELAGGPSQGYKYFTDSNVDWGQGLKELSEALTPQEKQNGIYLSYFGVADPKAYNLKYLDVGSDRLVFRKDDSDDPAVKPTSLAISATNLQATYYLDKTVFDWLKEKTPRTVAGHSIFIYDFSHDPESLQMLDRLRGVSE